MSDQQQPLDDLQHIKRMMERSSRFISLSGFSGIAAGICALAGALVAYKKIYQGKDHPNDSLIDIGGIQLMSDLLWIATITFIGAFVSAFFFTWLRSKKNNIPMWGNTTIRLFWNMVIPLLAGGIFIIRMLQLGVYDLVAPSCLIFYGLALVNASKYTLGEIRYLGYGQIALSIMNLWNIGYSLYFWAMGFGVLHIIYGIWMWNKYEKNS
ncbi:MAG: hypothetical protein ABI760_05745 [Ferruginibacter sp.]